MIATEKTFQLDEKGLVRACPHCGQRNRLAYERLGQTFRCGKCHTELALSAEPVEIDSAAAFDAVTSRAALPVLVDFWAPWCGPCRMVAPELEKVAQMGQGRWLVLKVNTEELPEIAARLQISAIPTMAVYYQGREAARQSGAMPAAGIVRFLEGAMRA